MFHFMSDPSYAGSVLIGTNLTFSDHNNIPLAWFFPMDPLFGPLVSKYLTV